jgi:hypothetical protein
MLHAITITSNIVITGYIGTVNGQVDAEARVYIDDLITVT